MAYVEDEENPRQHVDVDEQRRILRGSELHTSQEQDGL